MSSTESRLSFREVKDFITAQPCGGEEKPRELSCRFEMHSTTYVLIIAFL
jgi:hypothetical protein